MIPIRLQRSEAFVLARRNVVSFVPQTEEIEGLHLWYVRFCFACRLEWVMIGAGTGRFRSLAHAGA
jgi:hypothetical protein